MTTTNTKCPACLGSRLQTGHDLGAFGGEFTVPCEVCTVPRGPSCAYCDAPDCVLLSDGKPACDACRYERRVALAAEIARMSVAS